jgi:hypothetical protein
MELGRAAEIGGETQMETQMRMERRSGHEVQSRRNRRWISRIRI